MKRKNSLVIPLAIIALILIVVIIILSLVYNSNNEAIGGQTDSHGCLGPAGYSWNESIGACLREWELDLSKREAAKIAIAPISYPVTILEVETLKCPGCFKIKLQRNDNRNTVDIELSNWKTVSNLECKNYSYSDCPEKCAVCPPCEVCSSLSCNSKEFCDSIGFNESWRNSTKPPACNYESETKSYIKKEPNCVINFLCTQGSKAFSDSCGCGCEKLSQEPEKVYCTQDQKKAEVCPEYYSATCGWFNQGVKCFKYPCAQEFSNPCFACAAENVEYYTAGECPK